MKDIINLVCIGWLISSAYAQNPKLSPELARVDPDSNVQVIVQYKEDPTDSDHQKVINRGGKHLNTLHSIKGGSYSMPANAIADLANDASVAHISIDHKMYPKTTSAPLPLGYSTATVNAPTAWANGYDGTGVGVAVIDSGINPAYDLNHVVYQQTFWPASTVQPQPAGPSDTNDHFGHGTHVAGIIAGNGRRSQCSQCTMTFMGVAPNVNLLNLRVLDANGETTESQVIAAIEAGIQMKSQYNIRVINLSLGTPVTESYTLDPLCQAAEAAWKAGIVVVVAAGNEGRDNIAHNFGYGTITSPGNDPYVITVGAMKSENTYTRTDDLIASYSSKGPTVVDNVVKPDLVAPGNLVISIMMPGSVPLAPPNSPNLISMATYTTAAPTQLSSQYFSLSGTSMAAGFVSGAAAILFEAHPNWTPDQVKACLMMTASKSFPKSSVAVDPTTGISYTSYYDAFTRGAGYLDLAAALEQTGVPNGSALSPTASFNPFRNEVVLNFGFNSIWSNSGGWGYGRTWSVGDVWGTSLLNPDLSLAASSAVWGESAVWGASSVWSTSGVWSTSAIWGTSGVWSTSSVWSSSDTVNGSNAVALYGEQ